MGNSELFINECAYSDFDEKGALDRLSRAIQCKTTSYLDTSRIDYGEFDKIVELIKASYPNIMAKGKLEMVDHSVLIEIKGEDESLRPGMFISHLDVVPIVKGTEKDWLHDPFSGDIADGYVWGRGTLDIKEQVFGTLEALEYILSKGQKPSRTIYLGFGQDEETIQTGAYSIGQLLKSRGVQLEFLLDEGGSNITDAKALGAPSVKMATIALYEKGYADVAIRAKSKGGHSSRPFFGTSLGKLSIAIADIVKNPLKGELPDCVIKALEILKPYIEEEPMRSYVQDIEGNRERIVEYYLNNQELFNQVITTIAPTMIEGGSSAGNVMPQNMEAVINFRLAPQDTLETLMAHLRSLVDEELELAYVSANDASTPSNADSYGYKKLVETLEFFYRDVVFVPGVFTGSTDARNYECICDCCLRRRPFLEDGKINDEGVHGTNERIAIRTYMQGIRTLIHFMENTCF